MSLRYQEFSPSPNFARHIECFWSHESTDPVRNFRVLPDGCSDIIFERPAGSYGALAIVGAMTRPSVFRLRPRQWTFGVRFHPGMGARFLRVPSVEIVNRSMALNDSWNSLRTRQLLERLEESRSANECIRAFETALGQPLELDASEKALAWLVENRGQVPMDELADAASLSPRQFRRTCLERTGLSPKRLARVLRFRHALRHARPDRQRDWTDVALECGYYDQAHFINEFREFSGLAPGEFVPQQMEVPSPAPR
jgi:AraC-like DNA-binding protein